MSARRATFGTAILALAIPLGALSATPLWNAPVGTLHYWRQLQASPHDFTGSNPYTTYQITGVTDRCVVCHLPHNQKTTLKPLWNHATGTGYTMYGTTVAGNSPTSTPNDPTLRCLGCHDGSTKVDDFGGGPGSPSIVIASGNVANVGKDLRDDHPVSILMQTGTGWQGTQSYAKLYPISGSNYVECASCHDPHGSSTATQGYKFLRLNANICTDCHAK